MKDNTIFPVNGQVSSFKDERCNSCVSRALNRQEQVQVASTLACTHCHFIHSTQVSSINTG